MKCPVCNNKDNSMLEREWVYAGLIVRRHVCSECGSGYNLYFDDEKLKYTIPKYRN